MQDLLNEKEFARTETNPWRLFGVFYIIALIQLVLLIIVAAGDIAGASANGFAALALPIVTAFTMFFYKKKYAALPLRTLAISFLLLLGIYYIPVVAVALFAGAAFIEILICLAVFAVNYTLIMGIIMLFTKAKKKKPPLKT